MTRVEAGLAHECEGIVLLVGLSLAFSDWRLNLRMSKAEPLLCLNVERRRDAGALRSHMAHIEALIHG